MKNAMDLERAEYETALGRFEEFVGAVIDLYGDGPDAQSILSLNWTARVLGGTPAPADDISEIRWFAGDEIPGPDEIGFSSVVEILALWRERRG